MSHHHRAIPAISRDYGFTGPVGGPGRENRAAHGGVCQVDRCACGAERSTNINQCHVERGQWRVPTAEPTPEPTADFWAGRREIGIAGFRVRIVRAPGTGAPKVEVRHPDGQVTTATPEAVRLAAADWSDAPGTVAAKVYGAIEEAMDGLR